MEKQKIFLLVIAVGAIFILLQQGSQLPANRYRNLSFVEKNESPDENDIESTSKWRFNKFVNNEISRVLKPFSKKSKISHKFSIIDRFAIYEGNKQIRILLLAYFRSGSSFVGDLLQQNWKTFYSFEPLYYMTRQRRINDSNLDEAIDLINDIFNCDLPKNSSHRYTKLLKSYSFIVKWNHFFWNICKYKEMSLCRDMQFADQVCLRSKYNVIKSVRLKMSHLEPLLERMGRTNLKVIYLVRDPRGIYNSRRRMDWCNSDDCRNISSICEDMRQDLSDFDRVKSILGRDLVLTRYEDISTDPYEQTKQLFQSINLEFSPSVKRFLQTHTNFYRKRNAYQSNPYSTYRSNSTLTAMQWTNDLEKTEIQFAQQVCKDVLERLNYDFI